MSVLFWSKNESRIRRTILNDVFVLSFKKLKVIMTICYLSLLTLRKMGVFLSKNESWIRRTIPNDVFILNLKKLGNNYAYPELEPTNFEQNSALFLGSIKLQNDYQFSIDKVAIFKIKNKLFGAKMKSGYSEESQNSALFLGP